MQSEREKIESLGIPKHAIAALAGISQGRLSVFLADEDRVSAADRILIRAAIAQAVQLEMSIRNILVELLPANVARALGISWKNIGAVRALLSHLQSAAASE